MLESFFNNVASLTPCNFIKKGLQHSCFSREYSEIFKNTYFEICEWLLLTLSNNFDGILKLFKMTSHFFFKLQLCKYNPNINKQPHEGLWDKLVFSSSTNCYVNEYFNTLFVTINSSSVVRIFLNFPLSISF